jgi:hypothetical protein
MELEVFFTTIQQTYSKLVISFMNRKSSCGYATHFFIFIINYNFIQEKFTKFRITFVVFNWLPTQLVLVLGMSSFQLVCHWRESNLSSCFNSTSYFNFNYYK